jgi:hypothetical protein
LRYVAAILAALLCAALGSCAASRVPDTPPSFVADQLTQLETLQPPADVDPAQWGELKQALREMLLAGGDATVLPGVAAGRNASAAAAVTLQWNPASNELSWGYAAPGDYDQNGEVNIADLAPLGRWFGARGPFDAASLEAVTDGDGNAEINLADLTAIGANFGRRLSGYRCFFTRDETDLPTHGAALDAELAYGTATLDTASGDASVQRRQLALSFGPAAPNGWAWVRPLYGEEVGPASSVLRIGASAAQNLPPTAVLDEPARGTRAADGAVRRERLERPRRCAQRL